LDVGSLVSVTYRIRYVEDDLLEGRDWVMCEGFGDGVTLYLRRGMVKLPDEERARILEAAWAGFRNLQALPRQRNYSSLAFTH
jgi:hypothetical protein